MKTARHPWSSSLTLAAFSALAVLYADGALGQPERAASDIGAAPPRNLANDSGAGRRADSRDTGAEKITDNSAAAAEQLTVAQLKEQSKTLVSRIDSVEGQIGSMLESAQDERDVVRVLCLADKNNQVGLALGTARDRASSLLAALSRGAEARARHEYRLFVVVADRVEFLVAEANQCLGEETGPLGESSLVVDVDPNLPAPDPREIATPPVAIVVPVVPSPTD